MSFHKILSWNIDENSSSLLSALKIERLFSKSFCRQAFLNFYPLTIFE